MKRVLLTGGPTNEYIDEVMKITNMSTGSLTLKLAKAALDSGCSVCAILNESVVRSGLFLEYGLNDAENLKVVTVETTEEMYQALEAESAEKGGQGCDVAIHASAVGDYKGDFSFRMEDMAKELAQALEGKEGLSLQDREAFILDVMTNPACKADDSTKISSYEPHLTVKLTLTTKLIASLRHWFPDATLIGCKLLENVSKDHLVEVAQKLCVKNDMDFILANDLAELRKGYSTRHLVTKDGYSGISFDAPDSPESLLDYAKKHWF